MCALAYVEAQKPRPLHHASSPTAVVPEADWGHVRASDGGLLFILGPATDQRRRYELGFGRLVFTAARLFVADDDKGTNAVEIPFTVQGGGCIAHFEGHGVNALVEVRK